MAPDQSSPKERILLSEYHIATERTAAVAELGRQRATMKQSDCVKLLALVEDTRNECERVRSALAKLHRS